MSDLTVLVSAPYILSDLDRFRRLFEEAGIEILKAEVKERLSETELLPFAGRIDGALCGDDAFTASVLEKASPRLKVISKWGTGIDSIDVEAASQLGIKVTNTPGAFTDAVADTVLGYITAFARELPWMDQDIRNGQWKKRTARALHETTLGVIGVGRIGKAVLMRARGFNMRLLGNDIIEIDEDFLKANDIEMLTLGELLSASDFVSLNCDLNPTSLHLIDGETISHMKTNAVLINTSRGGVIDEAALVNALDAGLLAGAALDVFEDEPLPLESPLRSMSNVMLAPHNANSSPSAWELVHWNSLNNLFEGLGFEKIPEISEREVS